MYRNHEGYADPTQGEAIRAADTPPEAVSWLIKTYKELASLMGFEVVGRITLRDRKTKREWR
ncbi:MAG: hypothetical protein Q4D90_02630 [bacterium]|nr:hypothetical protein [bacterium]